MDITESVQCAKCTCGTKAERCGCVQKVIELKEIGVVIYCYNIPTETVTQDGETENITSTSQHVFVIHNTKNVKITSADILPQIDKYKSSCPRCIQILKHSSDVLNKISVIDENDTSGICDYCRSKSQTPDICACEEILRNKISTNDDQNEDSGHIEDMKKIINLGLMTLEHVLHKTSKTPPRKNKQRAYSEIDINLFSKYALKSAREPKVQAMFDFESSLSDTEITKKRKQKARDFDLENSMSVTEFNKMFRTPNKDSDIYKARQNLQQVTESDDYFKMTPKDRYLTTEEKNIYQKMINYTHEKEQQPTKSEEKPAEVKKTMEVQSKSVPESFKQEKLRPDTNEEKKKFEAKQTEEYQEEGKDKPDRERKKKQIEDKRKYDEEPQKNDTEIKEKKERKVQPEKRKIEAELQETMPKSLKDEKLKDTQKITQSNKLPDEKKITPKRPTIKTVDETSQKIEDSREKKNVSSKQKDETVKDKVTEKIDSSKKKQDDALDIEIKKIVEARKVAQETSKKKHDVVEDLPKKKKDTKEIEERSKKKPKEPEAIEEHIKKKPKDPVEKDEHPKVKPKEPVETEERSKSKPKEPVAKDKEYKQGILKELEEYSKRRNDDSVRQKKEPVPKEKEEQKVVTKKKRVPKAVKELSKSNQDISTKFEDNQQKSQVKLSVPKEIEERPKIVQDTSHKLEDASKKKNHISISDLVALEKSQRGKREIERPKRKQEITTEKENDIPKNKKLRSTRSSLLEKEMLNMMMARAKPINASADSVIFKIKRSATQKRPSKEDPIITKMLLQRMKSKSASNISNDDSSFEVDRESYELEYCNETPNSTGLEDIIIGDKMSKYKPPLLPQRVVGVKPILFHSEYIDEMDQNQDFKNKFSKKSKHKSKSKKTTNENDDEIQVKEALKEIENNSKSDEFSDETKSKQDTKANSLKKKIVPDPTPAKGIIRYALSDRSFIEKGWTKLPTEKVVRKMNVYRMRPAHPEFDWFEHNKGKGLMLYDSGEKLAEFDENGRGRWYYRNGRLALDYYEAEETNAQQRFVVFSSGEPDERGRSQPITILATFDYLGNGIVFDHTGKIRLKYNQTEGVVLDRGIGPVSHWKWHTLNDPPVLQQVMIDTQMAHKDPTIFKLGGPADNKTRPDNEDMLAIEFDNFIKEKSKKLSQKFKPFQIKMKALKINEHFSLRVLDQASIYLIFRDGSTNLKLNIGMVLDHQEIVDTDTAEVGEVANNIERFPARTDSLAGLQRSVAYAQRYERSRTERERRLRPTQACASADNLVAATSRPLRPPLRTAPTGSTSSAGFCRCSRKPSSNVYYNTRLM